MNPTEMPGMTRLAEGTFAALVVLAGAARWPVDAAEAWRTIALAEQRCAPPAVLAEQLTALGFEPAGPAWLIYVRERDQAPAGWTQQWSAPGWRVLVRARGESACITAEGLE